MQIITIMFRIIRYSIIALITTLFLSLQGQTITTFPYSPCFGDSLAPGWIAIDADGDGHGWTQMSIPANQAPADGCWISSASYLSGGVGALTPDNWLVSPPIAVNDSLFLLWQHKAVTTALAAEHYAVYVSTGGANTSDFLMSTPVYETTLTAADVASWVQQQVSLAAWIGDTVRVAFRHFNCHDVWHFHIDGITIKNPYLPELSITGLSSVVTNVNYSYAVSITNSATTGITYQWHSSLIPSASSTDSVFNIIYSTEGTDTVSVVVTNVHGSATSQIVVSVDNSMVIRYFPYLQDFENGMAGWSTLDNDEYSYNWTITSNGTSNHLNVNAHSGSQFIASESYRPNGNPGSMAPDNFLVSPPIYITNSNMQLEWWQRAYNSSFYADHYAVYISTNGPTVDNFIGTVPLYDSTIIAAEAVTWTQKSVSLTQYNGQTIWIAFRHFNCYDQWAVYLDDIVLTGNSDTPSWALTVDCDSTMGTVSGGGTYTDSSLVTITATPDSGYHFVGWNDGVTSNTRTILVVSDTSFTAIFTLDTIPMPPTPDTVWHTVNVSCDSTMGFVSGGGVYIDSSIVMMSAIPFDGYKFEQWNDGDTVNPRQVFIVSDTSFIAIFRVVDDSVGIRNIEIGMLDVEIYPNPSHGDISINVLQLSTISLFDVSGHTILPPTKVRSTLLIPCSLLKPGVYLVQVSTGTATTVKKLVVE